MNAIKKKLLLMTIITLSTTQFFDAAKILIKNDIDTKTHVLVKFAACPSWSRDLGPRSIHVAEKHLGTCLPKRIYITVYHPIGNNQFVPLKKDLTLWLDTETLIIAGPITKDNKIIYTVTRSIDKFAKTYSIVYEPSK
ncbi:MAG: hypothetical protein WBQ73_01050 [Candidatus Babeliales bacterium]